MDYTKMVEEAKLTDAEITLSYTFSPNVAFTVDYQERVKRAIADAATEKAISYISAALKAREAKVA